MPDPRPPLDDARFMALLRAALLQLRREQLERLLSLEAPPLRPGPTGCWGCIIRPSPVLPCHAPRPQPAGDTGRPCPAEAAGCPCQNHRPHYDRLGGGRDRGRRAPAAAAGVRSTRPGTQFAPGILPRPIKAKIMATTEETRCAPAGGPAGGGCEGCGEWAGDHQHLLFVTAGGCWAPCAKAPVADPPRPAW
jgi:hypothetical protein